MTCYENTGMGLGRYFRTTTEHVVFGVRGKHYVGVKNLPTHFTAPPVTKPDAQP